MEKNTLKFNEDLIKNCDEDSKKGYILEVDVEYPKDLHSDLPLLSEKKNKISAIRLYAVCMMKKNYVVHIRSLKQASNHGLVLKKYKK